MKTTAIIPVFNNGKTVGDVIEKTRRYVDAEVVADDGSTDDTPTILKELAERGRCTVLTHRKNLGKGAALKTAIRHLKSRSKGNGLEAVIFLDADGEHNPEEIPEFIAALKQADVVLGARPAHRSRMRSVMNRWMAAWFRLINPKITDPSCGFKAVRWDVLKKLELHSSDFCIDAEIVLEAIRTGASFASIRVSCHDHAPSSVTKRDYIQINNFFDGWVLRNKKELRISAPRHITLVAGATVGKAIGALLG